MTFRMMLSVVSTMPRRSGVFASPSGSERASDHEVDDHAEAEHEHDAEVLKGLRLHRGRGIHQSEKPRREDIPERRQDPDR